MKRAVLRHTHVLFCRKGPVMSQHTAAQGYASRVFPAFLYVVKSVGVPDWSSILQLGADNGLISSLSSGFLALRFLPKKPRDLFAVFDILVIWGFHNKLLAMSIPRYFAEDTTSSVWPCKI